MIIMQKLYLLSVFYRCNVEIRQSNSNTLLAFGQLMRKKWLLPHRMRSPCFTFVLLVTVRPFTHVLHTHDTTLCSVFETLCCIVTTTSWSSLQWRRPRLRIMRGFDVGRVISDETLSGVHKISTYTLRTSLHYLVTYYQQSHTFQTAANFSTSICHKLMQ